MRVTMIPIVNGELKTIPKGLQMGTKRVENQTTNQGHPNYSISEIGQDTEKSHGDLRKLAVTQTPVKGNQPTLNSLK